MKIIMKNVFPCLFIALLVAGCGGGGSSTVSGGTSPKTGSIRGKVAPESGAELSRVASGAERTATASTVNAKIYAYPSSTSLNGLKPNTRVPYTGTDTDGNYNITSVPVGLVNLVIDYDSDGIADERQFDLIVSKNSTTNTGTIEVAALNKDLHGSWCDVSLNKVNYSPGETIYMYVKGYNYDTTPLKCGMKVILQKGQGETQMWISDFNEPSTYVSMAAESASTGTIQKVIPTTWAPTDTQPGSDYRVYTIRENGDKWGKGDNFNIHCTATCGSDSECDDGNTNTTDICVNPETCGSLCSNVECDVTCASDSDCDDGNNLTTDTCSDAGTCSASCSHTQCSVTCSANIECNDGNSLTTDVCVNADTCVAVCLNNPCSVICGNDADCDDDNPLTEDVCKNPGMCFSTCSNTICSPTCVNDSSCNDSNELTIDTCNNPNTCNATCSNVSCTPMCAADSVCNDGNALTTDTCNNPGTCNASCSHVPCNVACTSNSQCNDGNALTTDTCNNPNTCSASCSHTQCNPVCVFNSGCNDSNSLTIDTCNNLGTCEASCAHTTITCNTNADCNAPTPVCINGGTTSAECAAEKLQSEKIAAGFAHTCTILSSGSIQCWGLNGQGQLGDNDVPLTNSAIPVAVVDITDAVAVATHQGAYHTCALLSSGSIKCWGRNDHGELGDIASFGYYSPIPVDVPGITNAVAIDAGENHTCALLSSGGIKCWGDNSNGQLGDGTANRSTTPVDVVEITDAIAISAGDKHTCALLSIGRIKCWGNNNWWQLGNGSTTGLSSLTPVDVVGITDAVDISAGFTLTCALISNGGVKCWGQSASGVGDGITNISPPGSPTPVDVVGITNAVDIVTGCSRACALLSGGGIKCWGGDNEYGQLGDGTTNNAPTSVDVVGITGAAAVDAGNIHTCVILPSGSIKCWGGNNYGQLGNGTTNDSLTPVAVVGF